MISRGDIRCVEETYKVGLEDSRLVPRCSDSAKYAKVVCIVSKGGLNSLDQSGWMHCSRRGSW